MNKVLICLQKNNGCIRLDVLDNRRKELVEIGNAIRIGNLELIQPHIKKAKDAGATNKDIEKVFDYILRDKENKTEIKELIKNTKKYSELNTTKNNFNLKPEIENLKTCYTDSDLIALLNSIREGDKKSIAYCIKKAYDSGANNKDILNVLSEIVGDERLLISIIETLKQLRNEKNKIKKFNLE